MSWTIAAGNVTIIFGVLILVFDDHGDRCASRASFKDTGENFHPVCLRTWGGILGLPRFSAVKIDLNVFFGQWKPTWAAVYYDTDTFSVGFSPCGDLKNSSCI